ncbi:hypothetical protein PCASD_07860 [Puccinia coronata f. sp. avenae]|uniref:Uncharacterized protein n=1 Tax=Puccinia coronata f. sp. avenae TaxID=200324 RepID=A0A2N5TF12_9BASI|nr:hypothetical protein PCASD_14284 [Puccinia coronata f. sp. avenae]PLW40093.1 hypothetical protein PCASD_07860 [Puccinia coronata f. sp. avenae]
MPVLPFIPGKRLVDESQISSEQPSLDSVHPDHSSYPSDARSSPAFAAPHETFHPTCTETTTCGKSLQCGHPCILEIPYPVKQVP